MCCTQLGGNAEPKNMPEIRHLGTIVQLCGAIYQRDNRKKNLVKNNISPTCPHNMVNFGPLAAEICLQV